MQGDKDRTNIFVKYLPPEVDNQGLHAMFNNYGKIVSAKVMVDQETGLSLGYGFVRFTYPREAKTAIDHMSGHKINNKTLLCRLSNSLAFPEPSTNLYIKPLSHDLTEEQLKQEFSEFGQILTVKIGREKSPPHSRIGFVKFENVECASRAIEAKNGSKMAPDLQPLIVKYSESDKKRALRKAKALPKHLAKLERDQHQNQAVAYLNTTSIRDATVQPSMDVMDAHPVYEAPSNPYMVPMYIPPEGWQYAQHRPPIPIQPMFDDYGRSAYQVLLVPYDMHQFGKMSMGYS